MKKTAAERQNAEKTVFKTTLVAKITKRNDPRTCENYRKLISRTGKTGLNRKNADKDSKKIKLSAAAAIKFPQILFGLGKFKPQFARSMGIVADNQRYLPANDFANQFVGKKTKTASGGGSRVPADILRLWQIQTPVRPFGGRRR